MSSFDEFQLIRDYFAPLSRNFPGALGLTDDAALLPARALATTMDALVAGVHFFPDDPPDLIIRKAIRVNLSDLAAMGAKPVAILSALCLPEDTDRSWLLAFCEGLGKDLDAFGVSLIGGDVTATGGPLTIAITAFGEIGANGPILRSNARSGDDIWISGFLGDAAFGLLAARKNQPALAAGAEAYLLDRYRLPVPRIALGLDMSGVAHAMMDVSDGLAGDLEHICRASGVGAMIDVERIPLSDAAKSAVRAGWGRGIETALTGGDDYELLFTTASEDARMIEGIGKQAGVLLTRIGRIGDFEGVKLAFEGKSMVVKTAGYRHFKNAKVEDEKKA